VIVLKLKKYKHVKDTIFSMINILMCKIQLVLQSLFLIKLTFLVANSTEVILF